MELSMIFRSAFEIILVAGTIWALFREERIADFERSLIARLRRKKLKVINTSDKKKANSSYFA